MSHSNVSDEEGETCSISSISTGFTPSMATSATSIDSGDGSMHSSSRPSSVFSITSSLRAFVYREEYGRNLNNYSEVYRLPADEEELERLDRQHAMFKEIMGKYAPPMTEVLAESEALGEPKTCVDLGCGSGSWILDVARDFPHVHTVAVDLVPLRVTGLSNLRSEVDDINLGLEHFYGDFDVVHARLISSGIRDYKTLVDHIASTVRPGGLVHLTEFDFRIYGMDKKPIVIVEKASALAKWMYLAHQAVKQQGGEPDAANHLHRWISEHRVFEDVVYRKWWIQTSNWNHGHEKDVKLLNRRGTAMRDDILAFLKSGRPLLLGSGIPEHVLNDCEDAARRELLAADIPTYVLVEDVYARRKRL